MVVAGAAGIERGHDGAELIAPRFVGEHMPAAAEAAIVVIAFIIGVPQIDQRARYRPAVARQNKPRQYDRPPAKSGLAQVGALRRTRLVERPFGLRRGRLVAILALRCRRQFLLRQRGLGEAKRAGGKRRGPACRSRRLGSCVIGVFLPRFHRRTSMASTAAFASASRAGSRERITTLVFGPNFSSK